MKRDRSLRRMGTGLLLIATVALLLVPGAGAQNKFKTLYKFKQGADGELPWAGLIFDQSGDLFGTTAFGGANSCSPHAGCGTVFKLAPNGNGTWTESVLYSFAGGNDGVEPLAGLVFDSAGNLYGTTLDGGPNGVGVVFRLTANTDGTWTESVLYSFCSLSNCGDGFTPIGGLILDQTGNLYGTTAQGGTNNAGTVFKLTPHQGGSWTESVLYSFTGNSNGADPQGALIFDQAGNLYGTAIGGGITSCRGGCGVIFELTPQNNGSWTESVLYSFTGGSDGGLPVGNVIFDSSGNLYGTTNQGGHVGRDCSVGCGVAFELSPNRDGSWAEKALHQFNVKQGAFPATGLTFDAAGNLYGTTQVDAAGFGTVFKLTPNSNGGWTQTQVHVFVNHPGSYPHAGVIFDAAGNLYGTSFGDGNQTFGSVFEITP